MTPLLWERACDEEEQPALGLSHWLTHASLQAGTDASKFLVANVCVWVGKQLEHSQCHM